MDENEIIKTMEEKLKELDRQYEDGMIDEAEYELKLYEVASAAHLAIKHQEWLMSECPVCSKTVESHSNPETQKSCSKAIRYSRR